MAFSHRMTFIWSWPITHITHVWLFIEINFSKEIISHNIYDLTDWLNKALNWTILDLLESMSRGTDHKQYKWKERHAKTIWLKQWLSYSKEKFIKSVFLNLALKCLHQLSKINRSIIPLQNFLLHRIWWHHITNRSCGFDLFVSQWILWLQTAWL